MPRAPRSGSRGRIAGTIRGWIDSGERIEATGAPIRPGGILILTRKRGAQTDAINRALKAAGVPVAGADRLKLGGHIAVMDLLALADFVLQPERRPGAGGAPEEPACRPRRGDAVPPSPMAAAARSGRRSSARRCLPVQAAAERLATWRGAGRISWGRTPSSPASSGRMAAGGASRARLGAEADEVLDEFLARALAQETEQAPSLQGFAAWMREAATEIKRDADIGRDEVRVMTVHGAKGLEADVVFLVDTGSAAVHASHDPKIVALAEDPDAPDARRSPGSRPMRRSRRRSRRRSKRSRERSREEYRRLLYVGLTRARDRLVIVCGTRRRAPASIRSGRISRSWRWSRAPASYR